MFLRKNFSRMSALENFLLHMLQLCNAAARELLPGLPPTPLSSSALPVKNWMIYSYSSDKTCMVYNIYDDIYQSGSQKTNFFATALDSGCICNKSKKDFQRMSVLENFLLHMLPLCDVAAQELLPGLPTTPITLSSSPLPVSKMRST